MSMVSSSKFSPLSDMTNPPGRMFLRFFVTSLTIVEFSFMRDNEFAKEGKFCESSTRARRGSSESEMRCVACKPKSLISHNFRGASEVSSDFPTISSRNARRPSTSFGYLFANVAKLNPDTLSSASSSPSGADASSSASASSALTLLSSIALYSIFFTASSTPNPARRKLASSDAPNAAHESLLAHAVSNSTGLKT